MTNNENEIRAQFEAEVPEYYDKRGRRDPQHGWIYYDPWVRGAWWAWQASRQALAVDLPSIQCIRINDYTAEETREACRLAIESQGVKCK